MWPGAYWRKAPLALVRRPPLFAAVLAASLLVALAAASSTLFATAVGNAALRAKLNEVTPFGAGLYAESPLSLPPHAKPAAWEAEADRRTKALARRVASIPSVQQPVTTLLGQPLAAAATPSGAAIEVRPVARPGFERHVHRIAGGGGDGVWLASTTARYLGLEPGGTLYVQPQHFFGSGKPAAVRVAATYRPLWDEPDTSYWANYADIIYPPPAGQDGPTPPTFLLGSARQIAALEGASGGFALDHVAEFPIATKGITLRRAERIQRRFAAVAAAGCGSRLPRCEIHSSLRAAIQLARRNVDAVSAPTRLLSDVGVLVALGVFAAAGAFLVVRRRAEVRLLYARGAPPVGFGAHTALESLLPTLLGAAAGFGLALGLVRLAQPTGALDGVALRSAAARAAIGTAAGLVLLAAAATAAFLRQYDATAWSGRRLGLVPWELPLLGLGVWLLVDVARGGGVGAGGAPSLEVFLVPLLLVAGAAGLALRLLRLGLARAARREAPLPVYLAVRRLVAGRGALVLLATLCSVALGLLFYAQTLAGSLAASAREKAYVAVGSDVQGTINADDPLPRGFRYPLTKVGIAYSAAEVGGPVGTQVDVVGVDPASLGGVVRWNAAWGQAPKRWLPRLDDAGPLRVVVPRGLAGIDAIWVSQERVPVRVAAVVRAFPGMTDRPFVVASRAALSRAVARAGAAGALDDASALVWGRGPAARVKTALAVSPLRPYYLLTVDDVLRNPEIAVATRTYAFLRALGVAVGALALVGLLLHLYARRRSQTIASAFGRRMGLSPRTELLALWAELAALLLVAAALAAAVAVAAALPVVRHTDPIPQYRPGPVVSVPWPWIAGTVAGVVVFALAGAAAAAALAGRADVGEELRLV